MDNIVFNDGHESILHNMIITNNRNEFILELIEKNICYKNLLITYTQIIKDVIDIILLYTYDLIQLYCRRHNTYVSVRLCNNFNIIIGVDTQINWISYDIMKYDYATMYSYNISKYNLYKKSVMYNMKYNFNKTFPRNIETSGIKLNKINDNHNFINYSLNYYMKLHCNKDDYINNTVLDYDEHDKYYACNIRESIETNYESYVSQQTKNILCIYEHTYDQLTQIISKHNNHTSENLCITTMQIINHHKTKRMINIIKLLSNIVSTYMKIITINNGKRVLFLTK